jgi:hypothetical protein
MRNGYWPDHGQDDCGLTLERPKLRGTTARFASQLFGKHVTKTNALESLVIAGFARGLSTLETAHRGGSAGSDDGPDARHRPRRPRPARATRMEHAGIPSKCHADSHDSHGLSEREHTLVDAGQGNLQLLTEILDGRQFHRSG